ncbi:MAG TPA: phosphoribosylformylglycinamidine synthase subunit PurS [Halanaerobiales bacterium]|nr:phosphoribosylformylglycinamidine synthase subunit PurS [Halanaerobiales bacterium]
MDWEVKIETKLKDGILDPQGKAVKTGLKQLGYDNVGSVYVGKYLELILDDIPNQAKAEDMVIDMCEKLLANPVIEDYKYELTKVER